MCDAPELKPCPFCGGKADFESVGMNSRTVWYRVMCSTGCCAGSAPHETCDEAAIAWNTRADTITALEEENKRLREAMERAARYADGIRGAVETNQVADKDVRGVAILIRNNLRAALEGE